VAAGIESALIYINHLKRVLVVFVSNSIRYDPWDFANLVYPLRQNSCRLKFSEKNLRLEMKKYK